MSHDQKVFACVLCLFMHNTLLACCKDQNGQCDGFSTDEDFNKETGQVYQDVTKSSPQETGVLKPSLQSNDRIPCSIDGFLVNCSWRSLNTVYPSWFPYNSKSVLINNNVLIKLENFVFSRLHNLNFLDLSHNKISKIEPLAFLGLQNLKFLFLNYNQLFGSSTNISMQAFQPLQNVEELHLIQDIESQQVDPPFFCLESLSQLRFLSFSTVNDTLHLGSEFLNLTNLVSLTVTGSTKYITDSTFENVRTLKKLFLQNMNILENIGENVFSPLKSLKSLKLKHVVYDLSEILSRLKPFKGRNMTEINLMSVSSSLTKALPLKNGTLNSNNTKYLTGICAQSVSLIGNIIYLIEPDAFADSKLWVTCLESLVISNSPLQGFGEAILPLTTYKSIRNVAVNNAFQSCSWFTSIPNGADGQHINVYRTEDKITKTKFLIARNTWRDSENHIAKYNYSKENNSTISNEHSTFYVPRTLKSINVASLVAALPLNINVTFLGADNVTNVDISNNGFYHFVGNIQGLTALKTLQMSGNDLSEMSPYFFDGFFSLETLYISKCGLNRDFMLRNSRKIFQNLTMLKELHLSLNYINALSVGTFYYNPKLTQLFLSGNQFNGIPFDLTFTKDLRLLDLSFNAIATIKPDQAKALDNLAVINEPFNLYLSGNILSCGCNDIRFLQWLRSTLVVLDYEGNYTCINQEGERSTTMAYSDLEFLWRQCWGEQFLYIALIIVCLYIIGVAVILLLLNNKTFLVSYLLQRLVNFRLHIREDYDNDVYIGYSDRDYTFPCQVLRVFIERSLKLNTYIIDRDMLPSLDKASGIVDAINSSWRILLVCSQSFLNDEDWSIFTMRSAIYALSPVNPARIVVLVHKSCLGQLPTELLSVVNDENIIVVSEWKMNYTISEMLRTRLA